MILCFPPACRKWHLRETFILEVNTSVFCLIVATIRMGAEFYSFLNSFVIFQYVVCAASPAVTAFAGFPFINIIINKTGI